MVLATMDLNDPKITDNDPGFGDISDILEYLPTYVLLFAFV